VTDEFWQAIVTCDAAYDGKFLYGVRSTGVFCRPSCKSRTPKRENARTFHSMQEALSDGFRACKRCRPDQQLWPEENLVRKAVILIEQHYSEPLTLEKMGFHLHLSPFHLHRTFHRRTGQTPADYLRQTRLAAAIRLLHQTDASITDIAVAVGFQNAGHFSTVFQRQHGMTPSAYRKRHLLHSKVKEGTCSEGRERNLLGFIYP
jgi:AraC family transcriptional regulator of adaptative response / methylphosphotriester-DNA alkyltransferase methyltransferase